MKNPHTTLFSLSEFLVVFLGVFQSHIVRSGASSKRIADGIKARKASSNSNVKSKFPRNPLTTGPNLLSAAELEFEAMIVGSTSNIRDHIETIKDAAGFPSTDIKLFHHSLN